MDERMPPKDEAAERALVGSAILDAGWLPVVRARVDAEDFSDPDLRAIWRAVLALDADGRPVDAVTLADALTASGDLERVGGVAALVSVMEGVPSAWNAEHYAEIVAERAARRRLVVTAVALERRACDMAEPVPATLDAARQELVTAANRLAAGEAFSLADTLATVVRAMAPDAEEGRRRWGCGVDAVDELTGGLSPGQVWVVGGRSRHCKTALAVGAVLATLEAGGDVLYAGYEESATRLMPRLLSRRTAVPYRDMQLRTLTEAQRARVATDAVAFAEECEGRLHVYHGLERAEIEARVAETRPWLLVCDTLQKMAHRHGGAGHDGRWDLTVGALTAWLATVAARGDLCVVATSQVGGHEHRGMPSFEGLRESKAIGEDADVALLVWWPVKERPELESTIVGPSETFEHGFVIDVAKNRDGGKGGRLWLRIDPGTQRLSRLGPEAAREMRSLL